jgi:hypothetical protein
MTLEPFVVLYLIIGGGVFGIMAIYLFISSEFFKKHTLPRAYSIAVIGFPQSGKTCLITSMFGELFANRIAGVMTVPRGKETIERINRDIAKLEIGQSLGPTTDQDLFAYRAEIVLRDFPFKKRYKVEIGDFPGEHSKKFTEQLGEWFHESNYFKWAMEADAFIFVVDLAHVLCPQERDEYIAGMKKAIRAAWHHLLEYHLAGKKNIRRKRMVLAFTKADLLVTSEQEIPRESSGRGEMVTEHVMKLGFGDTLPNPFHVEELSKEITSSIEEKFNDLIRHLRGQCRFLETVFVSAVAYDKNGRLGIRRLLGVLLPR